MKILKTLVLVGEMILRQDVGLIIYFFMGQYRLTTIDLSDQQIFYTDRNAMQIYE